VWRAVAATLGHTSPDGPVKPVIGSGGVTLYAGERAGECL